jgi:two-component system, OmpR family, sensor histidine kinase MtrB
VASSASGALAVSSYTAVSAYRERSFVERSRFQALTNAALLRRDVQPQDIEERLAAFGETLTADVVAVLGDRTFSSAPLLSEDLVPVELRELDALDADAAEVTVGDTGYRVVGVTAQRSGTELYFFFSRAELRESLRELLRILVVAWMAVTAIAGGVGIFVARRTLRPVRSAADAAHAVAEGLLDTRLEVSGSDEFSTLAQAFNEMAHALQTKLDELSAAHQRERRFTGDVAHELMTPLGALVTEASVLEAHLDQMPPTARRMAELVAADIRRLRQLVEELLELARVDAATAAGDAGPVRIEDVIARSIVAAGTPEGVVVEGDVEAVVVTNSGCLERILSNLVRNAIVHGRRPVTVGAKVSARSAEIQVRDAGDGIPGEHLPHVFDRFYKADPSRSGGGSGLGLAIALEYARLIGATLEAGNAPGGGALFTLRRPQSSVHATSARSARSASL